MSIYARFNDTNYALENLPSLVYSSRETTFSSIQIDFTGKTANDLPIAYQEIQIIDTDTSEIIYYGYAGTPTFPEFDGKNIRVILEIELLSPQTLLTKRTIQAQINNINIHDAVATILDDIVEKDGFVIAENTLSSTTYLSDIYRYSTIEKVLNDLGNRFNFVWYVDELKNIYLKALSKIETEEAILTINDEMGSEYLEKITPNFECADYANKISMTNVDLINTQTEIVPTSTVLSKGEEYTFTYPFSISENVVYRAPDFDAEVPGESYAFILSTTAGDFFTITIDRINKTITYNSHIGFSGIDDSNSNKYILLITDESNSKLITGFKWNYATSKTVDGDYGCMTQTAIMPFTSIFVDSAEIANVKDKINTSGIIEKTIDMNSKYLAYDELVEYCKSVFNQNNKQTNTVNLVFRGYIDDENFVNLKNSLKLTKKIHIDKENYFITANDYAITDIEYTINQNIGILTLSARTTNYLETFIDIFRISDEQLSENDIENIFTTFYNQDNKTILGHQILVNGEVVNEA